MRPATPSLRRSPTPAPALHHAPQGSQRILARLFRRPRPGDHERLTRLSCWLRPFGSITRPDDPLPRLRAEVDLALLQRRCAGPRRARISSSADSCGPARHRRRSAPRWPARAKSPITSTTAMSMSASSGGRPEISTPWDDSRPIRAWTRRVASLPRRYATRNSISSSVWFPLASMAWTSSLYLVPDCRNSWGIVMLVTDAGRSALNTRSGSSRSTMAR
jgi:hypothetical protein